MTDKLNVDAMFLGPRSENRVFFKEMMEFAINEHIHWRSDFHPEDPALVTPMDQYQPDFRQTLYKTEGILRQLSARLKSQSVPWFSPRYLGHMNADTLMVSNIAYMMTMLYNPNNCAQEASPVTTQLELDVGEDLAVMFGYDPNRAWGHITSGGTVANYEGLWVARNLKTMPLAMRRHPKAQALVAHLTENELLNLSPGQVLDLMDELKQAGWFEEVRELSARGVGIEPGKLGKLLVPQSKHYSWMKAMDVLGLGQQHIVSLPLDENYRTDVEAMREIVHQLMLDGTPILGVINVVGTTEEGSIDPVHKLIELRQECEQMYGRSFYVHIDAAYAGYARSMFLDQNDAFMPYDELIAYYREHQLIPQGVVWPKPEVYHAFEAMAQADSITVDPHKVGYIPYAAGAVVMKDRRIVDLISYHAAYVFEGAESEAEEAPMMLGSAVMEGSKAGATAAAVWAAHRLCPLNLTGYGAVIARGIVTADWLTKKLQAMPVIEVQGRQFELCPLMQPDFHMVNFTFKERGNHSLKDHNQLNQKIYEHCSYVSGRTYIKEFLTSSTTLSEHEHGDTPAIFARQRGFSSEEWQRDQEIYILRAAVMTQFLRDPVRFEEYWQALEATFKAILTRIVDDEAKEQRLSAADAIRG